MNRCENVELELVETHILACESCVTRLEILESEISHMKEVLQDWQARQTLVAEKQTSVEDKQLQPSWWSRLSDMLTMPKLAWAGAMAVVALGLALVPQMRTGTGAVAEASLSAVRGKEMVMVPRDRQVRLHLNASELATGSVRIEVVDQDETPLWTGQRTLQGGATDVVVPPIHETGPCFARLYSGEGNLLHEFSFDVR